MARNKYPEQTIEQILKVSEQLFIENGYEKTTIQDILSQLKMSKGAIYHHFKSKEEILQAIIYNKNQCEKELIKDLLANIRGVNAKEKIKKLMVSFLVGNAEIYDHKVNMVLFPEIKNPQLFLVGMQASVLEIAPMLAELIREGVADGSIDTKYPLEYAEIFMLLFSTWTKPLLFNWNKQQIYQRLLVLQQIMAQLGTDIIDEDIISRTVSFYENMGCFE